MVRASQPVSKEIQEDSRDPCSEKIPFVMTPSPFPTGRRESRRDLPHCMSPPCQVEVLRMQQDGALPTGKSEAVDVPTFPWEEQSWANGSLEAMFLSPDGEAVSSFLHPFASQSSA